MSGVNHTPVPWVVSGEGEASVEVSAGRRLVADVWAGDGAPDLSVARADAEFICRAVNGRTAILDELRGEADWLTERAKLFRDTAALTTAKSGKLADIAQVLRTEAARFDGRAFLIRQTLSNHGDRP